MKAKRLGGSELQVSEICLGTMTFGEQNDERSAALGGLAVEISAPAAAAPAAR